MLPFSSLGSIQEKLKGHRYREDNFDDEDAIEEELSSKFGISSKRRPKKQTYADLLLGPEFEDTDPVAQGYQKSSESAPDQYVEKQTQSAPRVSSDPSPLRDHSENWTLPLLSATLQSELRALQSITASLPAANGSTYDIVLCSDSTKRILGCDEDGSLSWLDDNTINCFTSLINARSEKMAGKQNLIHKPAKNKDVLTGRELELTFLGLTSSRY